MKMLRLFLGFAIVLGTISVAGCGGYPMRVESRTGAGQHELTTEERIRINRIYSRSRASGR